MNLRYKNALTSRYEAGFLMRTLVPGEWYILFTCSECKTRQILFPDLSEGRAALRATYKVECAKCGHMDKYESESLERYHHPPTSDPKPIYGIAFFALLALLRKGGMLRLRHLGRSFRSLNQTFQSR